MAGRVVVVGSVNVDLVVTSSRLPAPGETVTGGTFARHHGGKGGNQAVAAARLGAETLFVGAVGDDAFGTEARAALEAEEVDLSALALVRDEPTGVALILVDAQGENLISVASGANARLRPEHVRAAFEGIGATARDVVLVGHEIPTATAREALRLARAAGARSILNPAPAEGLDRAAFCLADVLTPNQTELRQLLAIESRRVGRPGPMPHGGERAARVLLEPSAEGHGPAAVLVTLGAAGALLVTLDGPPLELPAPSVRAIDTVGAGDAFNGALAASLARGLPLPEAARTAVAAGSLATIRAGAREGMPTAAELDAVLP